MKRLIDFKQLAEELGVNKAKIYQLRNQGMPHIRIGLKGYRVYLEDVMSWLETRTVEIEAANEE